jgi:hypothetical protein
MGFFNGLSFKKATTSVNTAKNALFDVSNKAFFMIKQRVLESG